MQSGDGERALGRSRSRSPRSRARNEELNVFLYVDEEGARAAAHAVDERVARGENVGVLAGVPVALKDNLCQTNIPTTCSSKILEGWRPPYNATVVDRLLAAGAIPVGKTNLDEFAMGSSTENSAFGPTRNPLDTSRVPGGSSGGSAAAVAADMTPLALGSDTGGSIRQPAALCGLIGVKPTYGLVSRYGLIAFASSLDQIGPLTKTVTDAAMALEAIAGHDPLDSTSLPEPSPVTGRPRRGRRRRQARRRGARTHRRRRRRGRGRGRASDRGRCATPAPRSSSSRCPSSAWV